jgi:hypothetical protein
MIPKDLFIKDPFKYDFYFYRQNEKVDFNKLKANKFYILVEYTDKEPILKFSLLQMIILKTIRILKTTMGKY